mmetsp:Transcript_44100/g.125813  ORF Transcript_44100/g.125813 Transcript_44100/m.125813 type:complete len:362 (-) Transcript_44100:89-1174(-)
MRGVTAWALVCLAVVMFLAAGIGCLIATGYNYTFVAVFAETASGTTTMTAASTTTTTTTHSSTTTMPPWCRPDAGSNCPAEDHWLDLMVQMDPAPGKVIVDIGCNKGNDIVAMMERYDQSHHWSTENYLAKLATRGLDRFSCPARAPKVKIREMKNRSAVASFPVGVCVEPMPTTTKVLRDVGNELGYNESVNYHVVQAAVVQEANPGQTIQMKLVEAGNEGSTLGAKDGTMAKVPAMTLDGIVATFGLHRIDMLHIDVEGWDPDVLFGGKRILESTRYMMFEVHRDIANSGWSRNTLRSVAGWLATKRFECYWANWPPTPILGGCWYEGWERMGWSNVMCLKASDMWAKMFRESSMKRRR